VVLALLSLLVAYLLSGLVRAQLGLRFLIFQDEFSFPFFLIDFALLALCFAAGFILLNRILEGTGRRGTRDAAASGEAPASWTQPLISNRSVMD
jgi:hypothetical protein